MLQKFSEIADLASEGADLEVKNRFHEAHRSPPVDAVNAAAGKTRDRKFLKTPELAITPL